MGNLCKKERIDKIVGIRDDVVICDAGIKAVHGIQEERFNVVFCWGKIMNLNFIYTVRDSFLV